MLSVRESLIKLLKEQTGLEVYYYMPPVNVSVSMPLLVLEEVENTDRFYRFYEDDTEQEITDVTYEVSIYSNSPMDLFVFVEIVDKIMKRAGFKKTYTSGDNHVEPLYCKTIRFTGKITLNKQNGNYMIYGWPRKDDINYGYVIGKNKS